MFKFGRSLHVNVNAKNNLHDNVEKIKALNDSLKCKYITYTDRAVTISGFRGSGDVSDVLNTGMSLPTRN